MRSSPQRIAVLSDVHGDLTAFEAVLADAAARGATAVLNLGDVAGKGPRGAACVALSRERCAVTVRGNWDEVLGDGRPLARAAMRWWRAELGPAACAWLAALPLSHHLQLSGRRVRLVHASTASPFTRVWGDHTEEEFAAMFAETELTGPGPEPRVVVYGDLHQAYVKTSGGRVLANCGSAGMALDGDPTASYLLLEGVPGGTASDPFAVTVVRVPFDVEAEVATAEGLGMPESAAYAAELRTGVYRGLQPGLQPG